MEAIWLAAAAFIPLVFDPWGCNAFELPKTRFLQALGLLACLAMLVRLVEAWNTLGRSALCPSVI